MTNTATGENARQRKENLRIAILPHVGAAKGHLLRAITLKTLLEQRFQTILILPTAARAFVQQYFPLLSCEWIDWHYGHNDVLAPLLSEVVTQIRTTASDLERILCSISADLVIGIPGFHTSAISRAIGIKHVSVLHGPWLLPEYCLPDLNDGEKAVVSSWRNAIQITDTLLRIVAQTFGLKDKGYEHWLENETLWIAQDFTSLEYAGRRPGVGFLCGDYGPRDCEGLPNNCLCLILGTALDGLREGLFRALSSSGLPLLVVGAAAHRGPEGTPNIYYTPARAATTLARISSMAVCHGGIGTVPVFAEAGVPQLFIPHDLDQAVNAMLAVRSGYGTTIDLSYWNKRTPFGRIRPPLATTVFQELLGKLASVGQLPDRPKVNDSDLIHAAVYRLQP